MATSPDTTMVSSTSNPHGIPPRPTADAHYLENATRIIFMGGLNYKVVDNKWLAFMTAFDGFDPNAVSGMTTEDIEHLANDASIIRNRKKLEATVGNAGEIVNLSREHGSFDSFVEGLVTSGGIGGAAKELAKRFSYVSENGATFWLYSAGWDIGDLSEKNAMKYAPYACRSKA